MVPRENKNNAYAKFWRTNKEHYGIFESGPLLNMASSASGPGQDEPNSAL